MCLGCRHSASPRVWRHGTDPASGTKAAGVPRPGLPAGGVPPYLRPIPVNTRDVRQLLAAQIKAETPKVQRVLYSSITANAETLKYQELRNAIATGGLTEAQVEVLRQGYNAMILETLAPEWERLARIGHDSVAAAMAGRTKRPVQFADQLDRMAEWTQARASELAVNMAEDDHATLRALITRYTVVEPTAPDELARILRRSIGLTLREAEAVDTHRLDLLAGMKNPRHEAFGMTPAGVEKKVQDYSAWLHRRRAERIARTEVAFAFNQGQLDTVQAAQDRGDAGILVKVVLASVDSRECPICSKLDGTRIPVGEKFNVEGRTQGSVFALAPPFHPNCRCTLIYEEATPEEARRIMASQRVAESPVRHTLASLTRALLTG